MINTRGVSSRGRGEGGEPCFETPDSESCFEIQDLSDDERNEARINCIEGMKGRVKIL